MPDAPAIRYTIRPRSPEAHLFEVSCRVERPDPAGARLRMPAWIPGSYRIRDFARNVVEIRARSEGRPLALEKLDKSTWRAAPCPGPLEVHYTVYAWELSVRAAYLDRTRGFFNGSNVFLEAVGTPGPCVAELLAPPADDCADWRVATTLEPVQVDEQGFGRYQAPDYETLIDHPVEMGRFDRIEFEAGGVPHALALSGRHEADLPRLAGDLTRICEAQQRLFGGAVPMPRYLFLATAVGEGYGGLEHRDSSALLCSRKELPRRGERPVSKDYRRFLGLCSHEYLHAWNVKRICPAAFRPYDLTREVHTRLLWAFEGITSYYDDLALLRSGVVSREDYLELLAQTVTRVLRAPGRRRQSVAESSFDAWTKLYQADENAPNAIVSYYGKGAVTALALDLTLREATGGLGSLDDVMRLLWRRYGEPGIGVPEDGVETAAEEVAGRPLQGFFDQALRGTEDLPLADLLARVGVTMTLRPQCGADDAGGKPAEDRDLPRSWLGARWSAADGGVRLDTVLEAGPAQAAGLAPGDVVVAVERLKVDAAALERRLAATAPGRELAVHAFRRDELMRFTVRVEAPPADTCVLAPAPEVDPGTAGRRDAWLAGG